MHCIDGFANCQSLALPYEFRLKVGMRARGKVRRKQRAHHGSQVLGRTASLHLIPHLMRHPYCRSADDRVRGHIFCAADAAPAGWRIESAMR